MYCIREDYTSRSEGCYDPEINITDNCQDQVYATASRLVQEHGYTSVLDIGCGRGFKLMKYFRDLKTLGLDLPPTVEWLQSEYPDREWKTILLDSMPPQGYDLVICADAIEHISNPDLLIEFIKKSKPKKIVISTPDRDIIQELFYPWYLSRDPEWKDFNGPPFNGCHLREWSFAEFEQYISQYFTIEEHFHAPKGEACQCIVADPVIDLLGKWLGHRSTTTVDGKGLAYLPESGDDTTYRKAAEFLNDGPVEDWGCGTCYAKQFFTQPYTGIDGTADYADIVADLRRYQSNTHGILIRHVLEHNFEWELILRNAIVSAKKLVLIVFTPFTEKTGPKNFHSIGVPNISFCKEDLTQWFPKFTEEIVGSETIFYITRDGDE